MRGSIRRWRLLWALSTIGLLLVAGMIVAAPQPIDPARPDYDYMVASNAVKQGNGSTAYTGSDIASALNWAVSHANAVVYVPSGTYMVSSKVDKFASGVTLFGDGPSETIFHFTDHALFGGWWPTNSGFQVINTGGVSFHDFQITEAGGIRYYAEFNSGSYSGGSVTDVTVKNTLATNFAGFDVCVDYGGTYTGLRFIRCVADHVGNTGFGLHGVEAWSPSDDGPHPQFNGVADLRQYGGWIKNTYFEDCKALYSSIDSRTWMFSPGYDLNENVNTENTLLVRCEASYNWESGFHFEGWGYSKNVVLRGCMASYNGQATNDPRGPMFGYGYYYKLPFHSDGYPLGLGSEVTMLNCIGTGNFGGYIGRAERYPP